MKLTKEQSDWLKNKFLQYQDDSEYGDVYIKNRHLIDLFKECTEKEFPDLKMYVSSCAIAGEPIKIYRTTDVDLGCACDLELKTLARYTHFTSDQFKEFTASCNKIVEWLDER